MEIFSCGVRRRRRSAPVNTSTIFSLRLVLNIVPRLPLKLRGAKCLDLQGANLRSAWGLGGEKPADVITTPMGAQAVIDLVGRIRHGIPC
ncbi:antitoxin Xre/MbcA/ParS toxin-binding domain-containing protein [Aeromonas caviae]